MLLVVILDVLGLLFMVLVLLFVIMYLIGLWLLHPNRISKIGMIGYKFINVMASLIILFNLANIIL